MGELSRTLVAVFPGQGSQYAGMSKPLTDNFSWTRSIFEEASDALKVNLLKLCAEGPEDELQLTFNAQPVILTTSYAWFSVLKRELDFRPRAAAGHSLGEYTALAAAEAIDLTTAVKLVRQRGEWMQSAVPVGKGKMAAVLGLEDSLIQELCQRASQKDSLVVPANFNAPGQVVIAGHTEAVERAEALAGGGDPKLKARKVIPLRVSAPFHSPLMKPVAEKMFTLLGQVNWKPLSIPVAFNLDGQLRDQANIAEMLRDQIDHPVQWTQCATALASVGRTYVEMGPGKVLTGLNKRIVDGSTCLSIDSVEDLKRFGGWLNEGKQDEVER